MNILIVDDKPENVYLLQTLLQGHGHRVTSVTNGAEALEVLPAQSFEMIIADILMPVMDGFQLCRNVKQDDQLKGTSFVFYTATYTDDSDEQFALALGADRFIRKPVDPEEFISIINDVVRDVQTGAVEPPRLALVDEEESFKLYSERLVKKLEKKLVDLDEEIARRKQAEDEQERLIAELETKNAALERYAYTVSHDLKSPLITIKGFMGYLEKDVAAGNLEQMQEDFTEISGAVEAMKRLLDELLELSRIGHIARSAEDVSLEELARTAVDRVARRVVLRKIAFDIAPDLPVVRGDRTQLSEVLQNLIDNAVKFTADEAAPRVKIGVRHEGDESVCYVQDNGIGVDPQYHGRIFGLFEQLDQNIEGTGVGLAIAKRIIEVHGGRLWLESEGLGKGATFCFTLPAGSAATKREDPDVA